MFWPWQVRFSPAVEKSRNDVRSTRGDCFKECRLSLAVLQIACKTIVRDSHKVVRGFNDILSAPYASNTLTNLDAFVLEMLLIKMVSPLLVMWFASPP